MKRLRLLLLPFAALVEMALLAACWVTALVHPEKAQRMIEWATSALPGSEWYFRK